MMIEFLAVLFMILGALFMLFAAIGLIRMPDIYMRMHSTTKSTSLGILLLFIGTALIFGSFQVWVKAFFTILFIFLTVPIASHIIGRVAHLLKIPKWEKSVRDDLEDDESKK